MMSFNMVVRIIARALIWNKCLISKERLSNKNDKWQRKSPIEKRIIPNGITIL